MSRRPRTAGAWTNASRDEDLITHHWLDDTALAARWSGQRLGTDQAVVVVVLSAEPLTPAPSFSHVFGPTTPSTVRLFLLW
jgi:hypothetical protein